MCGREYMSLDLVGLEAWDVVTPEICETFDEDDADDATRIGLKSVR